MTLGQILDKAEDFLLSHKMILLVVSGILMLLAYTGNIPSVINVGTQSILGGLGFAGLSIAAVLVLVAIAMVAMFSDEDEFTNPTLFLIPVFLFISAVLLTVGGLGAIFSDLFNFMQTLPGVILTILVGLIVLTKMKFFRMFK